MRLRSLSLSEQDETAIPEANTDLPAATPTNEAISHPERILAVLDLVRHGTITVDKGATMVGMSKEKFIHLLNKLSIPFEQ